ncbi:MAG: hypothetical protein M1830_006974, partial [Pleopsidium flavum]
YDALDPEEQESLERDVLHPSVSQHQRPGDPVILAIICEKSKPLKETGFYRKARSVKIILRIHQNRSESQIKISAGLVRSENMLEIQSVPQQSGPSLFGNAQLGPHELGLPSPPPISPPAPPLQPYPGPPAPPQLILGSQFPQPQFRRRPSPRAQFPLNHGKRITSSSCLLASTDKLVGLEKQMSYSARPAFEEDESTESTEDIVSNLEAAPSVQSSTTSKPRTSKENVVEDLLARYTTLYD